MTDYALRNATEEGTSQGAKAPADDDYDARAELLAEGDDLLGRSTETEVGLGELAARGPNPLDLFVEQSLGVISELGRLLLGVGVERRQEFADVNYVQLGARLFAELYGLLGSECCVLGSVGGEQDPGRENGHCLTSSSSLS